MKAQTVIDTILGEAAYGDRASRYQDMLGIASVITNRSVALGVTPQSVVSAPGQFSAYGQSLPSGVEAYRSLAEDAYNTIQTIGPITSATFYATPAATGNLPGGLQEVGRTTGHVYHEDPLGRAIATAEGYRAPDLGRLATIQVNVPTPTPAPRSGQPEQTISAPMREGTLEPRSIPVNEDMGPLMGSMTGASYMTNPNAVNVARSIMDGPYEEARQNYSMITGQPSLPAINDMIAKEGTSRESQTPGSQHFQGMAIDHSTRGMTDAQKLGLMESYMQAGAKGFGFGQNILHVDFRDTPAGWSYRGTGSTWAGRPIADMIAAARAGEMPVDMRAAGPMPGVPTPTPRESALATPSTTSPAAGAQAAGGFTDGSRALGPSPSSPAGGALAASGYMSPSPAVQPSLGPAPSSPAGGSLAASGGALAPATAPTGTSMADAYGQMAATMGAAGVRGLGAMPTAAPAATPAAPAPAGIPTFSPTMTAPAMNPAVAPRSVQTTQVTPARAPAPAPTPAPAPARGPAIAPTQTQARGGTIAPAQTPATGPLSGMRSALGGAMGGGQLASRAAYAAAGGLLGGLPGAIVGGLLGPALGRALGIGQPGQVTSPAGISYTPGLAFPAAPYGGGLLGGIPTNNSYADMASYSPAAAAAISEGRGGLY